MRTSLPLSLLVSLTLLGATACQKESEPAPEAPTATSYKLDRTVSYPVSLESSGVSHSPSHITGTIATNGGGLTLRFRSGDPSEDNIVFVLDYSKLIPGRVGKYPLQSLTDPTNPTQATYTLTYSSGPNALIGKMYRTNAQKTTGDLTISTYDTRRGLMSGSYHLKLTELPDPYADLTPNRPIRICDIVVTGEFTNVPVQ